MLQGICIGLQKEETNVQIQVTALTALRDSLKFYKEQFKEQMTRDHVIKWVLDKVNNENIDI